MVRFSLFALFLMMKTTLSLLSTKTTRFFPSLKSTLITDFQQSLDSQLILAPLTRGGNLPFRNLCAEFGAIFTESEMVIARNLFKGPSQRKERALTKKGRLETYFGVQIATKCHDEALRAAELAAEAGASWLDLNSGCPIYEATHRGLGSAMLKKPAVLEKMVSATKAQLAPYFLSSNAVLKQYLHSVKKVY